MKNDKYIELSQIKYIFKNNLELTSECTTSVN